MRRATLVLLLVLTACNDLRGFEGSWQGPRVGTSPALRVGLAATATSTLAIDAIDTHGLRGRLSIGGLVDGAELVSIAGAEADVLAGMTFNGSPLRVYLSFLSVPDGGGEALAIIALYDDRRVEVRVLRGGATPLYGIFAMTEVP